jgi:hypothetical protein
MIPRIAPYLAAVVLIALGGFLIYGYGAAQYQSGYDKCKLDAVSVIDQTARKLERQRNENIKDSDVIKHLHSKGWLRADDDL